MQYAYIIVIGTQRHCHLESIFCKHGVEGKLLDGRAQLMQDDRAQLDCVVWAERQHLESKGSKGKFLYSTVSSDFPGSLVHTISYFWEASSHAAINAQRLLVQISTNVYSQVLIHTAKLTWAI